MGIFALPEKDVTVKLEIHFHEQEVASVFLENNGISAAANFGEVYIFILYAIRQLATLGEPEAGMLAPLLFNCTDIIPDLAGRHELGGVKIIQYPGKQGRKVLHAKFSLRQNSQSFHFNTKGFGLFSSGIGYYSPTSVFVLLRYLAMKHAADEEYLTKLAESAKLCGASHLNRHLSMTNQTQIAFTIAGNLLH